MASILEYISGVYESGLYWVLLLFRMTQYTAYIQGTNYIIYTYLSCNFYVFFFFF